MAIAGRLPDDLFHGRPSHPPERKDKEMPAHIRRCFFQEASVTAFLLEDTA